MASNYEENLAAQLAMLDTTWESFVEHGVTDETELVLDFMYIAPNKTAATQLSAFLENYDTTVGSEGLLKKRWFVEGKSHPTRVSRQILEQWLDYMVAAGWEVGCEFDGFGATMPNAG